VTFLSHIIRTACAHEHSCFFHISPPSLVVVPSHLASLGTSAVTQFMNVLPTVEVHRRQVEDRYSNTTADGYCFAWALMQLAIQQNIYCGNLNSLASFFPVLLEWFQQSDEACAHINQVWSRYMQHPNTRTRTRRMLDFNLWFDAVILMHMRSPLQCHLWERTEGDMAYLIATTALDSEHQIPVQQLLKGEDLLRLAIHDNSFVHWHEHFAVTSRTDVLTQTRMREAYDDLQSNMARADISRRQEPLIIDLTDTPPSTPPSCPPHIVSKDTTCINTSPTVRTSVDELETRPVHTILCSPP
jgi:hypothetical protein